MSDMAPVRSPGVTANAAAVNTGAANARTPDPPPPAGRQVPVGIQQEERDEGGERRHEDPPVDPGRCPGEGQPSGVDDDRMGRVGAVGEGEEGQRRDAQEQPSDRVRGLADHDGPPHPQVDGRPQGGDRQEEPVQAVLTRETAAQGQRHGRQDQPPVEGDDGVRGPASPDGGHGDAPSFIETIVAHATRCETGMVAEVFRT